MEKDIEGKVADDLLGALGEQLSAARQRRVLSHFGVDDGDL